jgi:hypothetical protein
MMTSCLGGAANGVRESPCFDSIALVDDPPAELHIGGSSSCKAMSFEGAGRETEERSDLALREKHRVRLFYSGL